MKTTKMLCRFLILLGAMFAVPGLHAQATLPHPAVCGPTEKITPIVDHGATGSSDCVYNPPISNTGTKVVATAAGLKAALAAAKCGDTLLLPVATYTIQGNITLTQVCVTPKIITVRTASALSTLPTAGGTLTPAYAGYATAPEVAPYPGPFKRVVPQIILNQNSRFIGGTGFRWVGIEVTVPAAATYYQSNLFDVSAHGHWIFDRSYVHGAPKAQITRGVYASGSNHIAFLGSTFSDFHCVANGACTDSQAVGSGIGDMGAGFDFLNNFLSASAENILFGGGGDGANHKTATGVRVWGNHLYKPLSWEKGQPNYNGMNFSVKNNFELKNAQNVEMIGNKLENNWGGYSQPGYCVLFTPKNQGGKAPGAHVTNVIFAYNEVDNCGSGMQIASAKDDNGSSSMGGGFISVHDILFNGIDGAKNFGDSTGIQITPMDPVPQFDNFYFGNLTFFGTPNAKAAFELGSQKMNNITVVNSIFNAGKYGAVRTGAKGVDCSTTGGNAHLDLMLKSCWTNPVWTNNLVVGTAVGATWPAGTTNITTSPFVSATDPHVLPAYAGLGADIDTIKALMLKITY